VSGFLATYWESLALWLPPLLRAARVTLLVAVLSIAVGAVVGLFLALLKMGGKAPLHKAASFYIEVTRGTPALAQLYIAYFGLASVGLTLDNVTATVVALGLNAAAYMAEIYRAGIESVHGGQREAAMSLGMTPGQAMRFIVLPQAWRVVLPPAANLGIAVLKDTSLASAIATPELMSRAYDLVGQTWRPMHIYLLVAVMYMAMCLPLAQIVRRLERGVKRSDVPTAKAPGSVGWRQRATAA
jgi:polar amino acid transport system permease protein